MKFSRWFIAASVSLFPFAAAQSSAGSSVLVVLDNSVKQEDYSTFFEGLESRGYELTFRNATSERPSVLKYETPQFSHIILFAPETKAPSKDLSPQGIINLLRSDQSPNILIALGSQPSSFRTLAGEFGVSLPPQDTVLVSHVPPRSTPHTLVPISVSEKSPVLPHHENPVLFEGVAHALIGNPALFPILSAPAESFSTDVFDDEGAEVLTEVGQKGGEGLWAGSKMSVASGFQTLNGARVAFVGGVSLFSDEFAKQQKYSNWEVAQELAAWTFKESMVLKVENVSHHLESDASKTPAEAYTINNNLVFSMDVSIWDPSSAQYIPHETIEDMQLEFTMLDPHIRTALKPIPGVPGRYGVTFRAPDRHGVFKFVVNYKRHGWSAIQVSQSVAVVPPRHDGYPRFLSSAWPYYAGAFSTSLGFVLFCVIYLGGEAETARKRQAKGKGKVE